MINTGLVDKCFLHI